MISFVRMKWYAGQYVLEILFTSPTLFLPEPVLPLLGRLNMVLVNRFTTSNCSKAFILYEWPSQICTSQAWPDHGQWIIHPEDMAWMNPTLVRQSIKCKVCPRSAWVSNTRWREGLGQSCIIIFKWEWWVAMNSGHRDSYMATNTPNYIGFTLCGWP